MPARAGAIGAKVGLSRRRWESVATRASSSLPIALACAAIGTLMSIAIGSNVVSHAREHDFLDLYTGATLALHGDFARLDDYREQLQTEQAIAPDAKRPLIPFMRPPFYAVALAPLALLPFRTAFVVWLAIQIVLLAVCWWVAYRRFGPNAVILSAFFLLPGLGIAHGQDAVFVLLPLMLGYLELERGRDLAAGALIGLTLFKFHLFPFIPVLFLLHRRWRALAGYTAVGAALAGAWLALSSPLAYWRLIFDPRVVRAATPDLFLNADAIPANFGVGSLAITLVLMAVVAGLVLVATGREACPTAFAAAVAGSLAFTPHVYKYDGTALLLPFLLGAFASQSRWTRYAAWAAACPVVYVVAAFRRPWGVLPPLTLLIFVAVLAVERLQACGLAGAGSTGERVTANRIGSMSAILK
jgi:Glycosyltransferase family 87